jgi:UDP-N-acetyl-D-mannosaminuronate dehydrogenase
VALLGLSYKANVGDDRESPAYDIKEILEERGADLVSYDPFVPANSSVNSLDAALQHASAIVIAAGHKDFLNHINEKTLKDNDIRVVIDGRNIFKKSKDKFQKAGTIYRGIGQS